MPAAFAMPIDALTRDNTLLSRPNIEPPGGPPRVNADASERPTYMLVCAGTCTNTLRAGVEAYVQAGIASATKRAYRADLNHFEAWGGTIPTTDIQVAAYLVDHAAVLKVSTLTRRLTRRCAKILNRGSSSRRRPAFASLRRFSHGIVSIGKPVRSSPWARAAAWWPRRSLTRWRPS